MLAVWGSGPTDIYAVGDNGHIEHSTGDGQWKTQPSGTGETLYGLWGSGPGDVYVAVYSNVIFHSKGDGKWEHQQFPVGINFHGVWGSSAGDVYAFYGGVYHGRVVHLAAIPEGYFL